MSIGKIWGEIWEPEIWNVAIWEQEDSDACSPGRVWSPIWRCNTWSNGVWATVGPHTFHLVPIDTLENVGWSIQGASTLHEALADNSDTSFVKSTVPQAQFFTRLSVPDAPFHYIQSMTVNVRLRK